MWIYVVCLAILTMKVTKHVKHLALAQEKLIVYIHTLLCEIVSSLITLITEL